MEFARLLERELSDREKEVRDLHRGHQQRDSDSGMLSPAFLAGVQTALAT